MLLTVNVIRLRIDKVQDDYKEETSEWVLPRKVQKFAKTSKEIASKIVKCLLHYGHAL